MKNVVSNFLDDQWEDEELYDDGDLCDNEAPHDDGDLCDDEDPHDGDLCDDEDPYDGDFEDPYDDGDMYDDEELYDGENFAFLNEDEDFYDEEDDSYDEEDDSYDVGDDSYDEEDDFSDEDNFCNSFREKKQSYEETEKYFKAANFMITKEPFYISREGFYNDEQNKIFRIIMNYRMRHCGLKECFFAMKELKDTDVIALYGHFHKMLPDGVVNWLGEDIDVVRFDDYFAEQRKIRRSRRKDCKATKAKSDIEVRISEWLVKTPYSVFEETICSRVQGQEGVKYLLAMIYTYMKNISKGRPSNDCNVLITAPSGCGKTETYRALRDYFAEEIPELPINQVDMTSITEEGFRGKDTNDIVRCLFNHSETNGVGLIFMDEFDKKLMPSYTSQNVNVNAAVQAQILTLIEGRQVSQGDTVIDTSRTFFVGMGSFDTCRKKRNEVKRDIGFGAKEPKRKDHYDEITRNDMIELGASYELIGRFSSIINFHPLSKKIVNQIIDGFLHKKEEYLDCKIKITRKFRGHMLEASNSEFGCRNLKSMIDEAIMPATCQLNRFEDDKEILIILDYKNNQNRCQIKEIVEDNEVTH